MNAVGKRFLYSLALLVISILLVLFLWEYTLILSLSLIVLELIKFKLVPIKKEIVWYFLTVIISTLVEVILVNIGGAWSYAQSSVLNVPIYMPLLWGLVATIIIVIYQEIFENKK